jgi:hypothetical protein
VKDTSAPTASLKSAKQLKVVVKFDRAVGINGTTTPLDKRYFYHTYATWNPDTVTPNKTTNATEYTLTFDNNSLQPGDVVVTVLKTKGTDLDVKDAWGNKMAADAKLATTIVADVTPPEMDGVTYKSNRIKKLQPLRYQYLKKLKALHMVISLFLIQMEMKYQLLNQQKIILKKRLIQMVWFIHIHLENLFQVATIN